MMGYRVIPDGARKVRSICNACGWRSDPYSSGGLAGAAFDEHAEHVHEAA